MTWKLVIIAVSIRVLVALTTQTFFQPDEYYQSLEVAHRLVFGYGHITWEWLTQQPIRSIVYPILNVPVYLALKQLRLDNTRLLIWGPKVLHGVLASLTDIYICKLTRRVAGERYVLIAFWLSLTSLFHGLSLSRSLSNSLETSLTTMALSLYPWDARAASWRRDYVNSLTVAALACAVRPTNVILWVYMLGTTAWRLRRQPKALFVMVIATFLVGVGAITLLCAVDSWYYGSLTLTPLNFAITNLSSVSLFYGSSAWHYYLTQGIPILCGSVTPFALQAIYKYSRHQNQNQNHVRRMTGLVVWTVLIYSLAGHKEWRFIHPLLPLFHILATISLIDSHDILGRRAVSRSTTASKASLLPKTRGSYWLVFVLNLPPLLYLMLLHSKAQIDVMYYLRSLNADDIRSIGFLMPCHSTPWQAYLHQASLTDSGRLWALGCEPPVGVKAEGYRDQTDVFYESPVEYIRERFPPSVDPRFPASPKPFTVPGRPPPERYDWKHEWPQYLVMFGALLNEQEISNYLSDRGYRQVWHEERGWEGDRRRQGGVTVLKFHSHE
ncbi:glycosyltransferase family 22 protein [Irpex rosettiformis]|uniref:Glycosyltransferase family 22 protein n=1 Tax=Irpex rosettiformis TaxID=378272 RepID=A0ACB8TVX5_9APHY|nr:glycosyltransferase family 22 protein [Irpex rosettiformis]